VGCKVSGLGTQDFKLIVPETQSKSRTCILARKHFCIFLLHNFSNEDNTAASLELQQTPIRLLSSYMAYDHADPPDEKMRSLTKDCENKQIGLVVGCDANAHHTQWGSTNTNVRGESLLDYILSTDQLICNKSNDPTFIIKNRKEVIDLTLASHIIFESIQEWKVSTEHSFSDHRYIEIV